MWRDLRCGLFRMVRTLGETVAVLMWIYVCAFGSEVIVGVVARMEFGGKDLQGSQLFIACSGWLLWGFGLFSYSLLLVHRFQTHCCIWQFVHLPLLFVLVILPLMETPGVMLYCFPSFLVLFVVFSNLISATLRCHMVSQGHIFCSIGMGVSHVCQVSFCNNENHLGSTVSEIVSATKNISFQSSLSHQNEHTTYARTVWWLKCSSTS